MRMAMGSEETVRKQSKQMVEGGRASTSSGMFEKSSFQDFTFKKYKEFMFDDGMGKFLDEVEHTLEAKKAK